MGADVITESIPIAGPGDAPGPLAYGTLTYTRYLPSGYPLGEHRYPVLYLLSDVRIGSEMWGELWSGLDTLIAESAIDPVIVVVPDAGSVGADAEHFHDLIAAIDKRYRTMAAREGRFLAGHRTGGGSAIRCALKNPELFGAAVMLNSEACSGEPLSDSLTGLLREYVLQSHRVPMYLFADEDENAVEAVRLYQELHRKPLDGSMLQEEIDDFPTSPAELRIVCGVPGGHQHDRLVCGLVEGLKYMTGKRESEELSPRYDAAVYKSGKRGSVTVREFTHEPDPSGYRFPYHVYLPHGYNDNAAMRYQVVYLLHGSGASLSEWDAYWPIIDKMIETGRVKPFIAVAPITGNSYWIDSIKYGPAETALIEGLIPLIDSRYRTVGTREGRAVLGFSMGGYGALRYALTYPDLFGNAALLSPALQEGMARATSGAVRRGSFGDPFDPALWTRLNYPYALNSYMNQPHRVAFFIIAGDDDWNHVYERYDSPDEAVKCNMEMQSVLLYDKLRKARTPEEDRLLLRIVNGGHDMDVWAHGFEEGIAFMLGR